MVATSAVLNGPWCKIEECTRPVAEGFKNVPEARQAVVQDIFEDSPGLLVLEHKGHEGDDKALFATVIYGGEKISWGILGRETEPHRRYGIGSVCIRVEDEGGVDHFDYELDDHDHGDGLAPIIADHAQCSVSQARHLLARGAIYSPDLDSVRSIRVD